VTRRLLQTRRLAALSVLILLWLGLALPAPGHHKSDHEPIGHCQDQNPHSDNPYCAGPSAQTVLTLPPIDITEVILPTTTSVSVSASVSVSIGPQPTLAPVTTKTTATSLVTTTEPPTTKVEPTTQPLPTIPTAPTLVAPTSAATSVASTSLISTSTTLIAAAVQSGGDPWVFLVAALLILVGIGAIIRSVANQPTHDSDTHETERQQVTQRQASLDARLRAEERRRGLR